MLINKGILCFDGTVQPYAFLLYAPKPHPQPTPQSDLGIDVWSLGRFPTDRKWGVRLAVCDVHVCSHVWSQWGGLVRCLMYDECPLCTLRILANTL